MKSETSKPLEKALAVIEYMNMRHDRAYTLEDLSRDSGVAKTTLLRIMNTLIDYGYVSKTRKKRYVTNFYLTKLLPLDPAHHRHLESVLREIATETGQSGEIITINGKNLYWYDKAESRQLPLKIAAYPGFRRSLYELDAPARLYLKHLSIDTVSQQFDTTGFYTAAPAYSSVSWEEATAIIEPVDPKEIEYDLEGNRNGIRRFCVLVESKSGEFQYILAIAEAALRIPDEAAHIETNCSILKRHVKRLTQLPKEILDPEEGSTPA
jgi:DNA-binding IclR family transcriptional regulator